MNILHITDFHLDNIEKGEVLRKDFYDEYINILLEEMNKNNDQNIDIIAITGDLVEKGNFNNFDHAVEIISYLSKQLKVSEQKIFICPGNHDVDRKKDKKQNYSQAREPYYELAKKYGNESHVCDSEYAQFCKIESNTWILILDSSLGSDGDNVAGNISEEKIDEILSWVKTHVSENDCLLVLSHHPVPAAASHLGPFDDADRRWAEKHIWSNGQVIAKRLQQINKLKIIVWFSGDIHKNFSLKMDACYFNITGRFGTKSGSITSVMRRHARVVSINDHQTYRCHIYEYDTGGHSDQSQVGEWNLTKHKVQEIRDIDGVEDSDFDEHEEFVRESNVQEINQDSILDVALISENLEDEIIRVIQDDSLYKLGRFKTQPSCSSLSWVSMGPLLNKANLFTNVINEMSIAIDADGESLDNSVIFGIDNWGAAIASQISVKLGIQCFPLATRGDGSSHIKPEIISTRILDHISSVKHIYLISDVISTGISIKNIYDQIHDSLANPEETKWHSFSVICYSDKSYKTLEFLETIRTACKILPMPTIPDSMLPSNQILKPSIKFV